MSGAEAIVSVRVSRDGDYQHERQFWSRGRRERAVAGARAAKLAAAVRAQRLTADHFESSPHWRRAVTFNYDGATETHSWRSTVQP